MEIDMVICGDALTELKKLPDESVHCCVTSPPYWGLRDYGTPGQLGLEKTPDEYVAKVVEVFHEVRRVLRDDGTLWLNLGDSYHGGGGGNYGNGKSVSSHKTHPTNFHNRQDVPGLKPKDLVGIPWRVAFALQADGWYLRQDIIWAKPNPMPESVTDRCTKSHEYIFLLAKNGGKSLLWRAKDTNEWSYAPDLLEVLIDSEGKETPRWRGFDYYYDAEEIKEPAKNEPSWNNHPHTIPKGHDRGTRAGLHKIEPSSTRNRRSVWTITTKPFRGAHFATFPPDLIEPMIKAGCLVGGIVLDPFFGAGTTGLVASKLGRDYIGIELNPSYVEMAKKRINGNLFAGDSKVLDFCRGK
jgi:DNA modification methylase